jgi:hypothetical protein
MSGLEETLQSITATALHELETAEFDLDKVIEKNKGHNVLTDERYLDILSLEREYRKATDECYCTQCGAHWRQKSITDLECESCHNRSIRFRGKTLTGMPINLTPRAQIPVLHNDGRAHGEPDYTMLYSNTENAHKQGMTREWVVVYASFPEEEYKIRHTYTVISVREGIKKYRQIAGTSNPAISQMALDLEEENLPKEGVNPPTYVRLPEEVYARLREPLERLASELPITQEEAEDLRIAMGYLMREED